MIVCLDSGWLTISDWVGGEDDDWFVDIEVGKDAVRFLGTSSGLMALDVSTYTPNIWFFQEWLKEFLQDDPTEYFVIEHESVRSEDEDT